MTGFGNVTSHRHISDVRGSKKGLFRSNSQTITPRKCSTNRTQKTSRYWEKVLQENPIETKSKIFVENSIEKRSKFWENSPIEMFLKDDERIKTIGDWYNWCRQDTTSSSTLKRNRQNLNLTFKEIVLCIFAKEMSLNENSKEIDEQQLEEEHSCSQESLEVRLILSNGAPQELVSDLDSETSIKSDVQVETRIDPDLVVETRTKPEPPQPRPRTIFLSEKNVSEISQDFHPYSKVLIYLNSNSIYNDSCFKVDVEIAEAF